MVLGAILLFVGLICLFKYFREDAANAALEQNMFKGLIALSLGGFCVLGNGFIVEISALLTFVYGVVILITGFSKIQKTIDLLRLKKTKWGFTAISAAVTVICAALILFNPFGATEWIWRFMKRLLMHWRFFWAVRTGLLKQKRQRRIRKKKIKA